MRNVFLPLLLGAVVACGDKEDTGGHGHDHGHDHGPHDGVVATFRGPDGKDAGHLELKLHDDKGDLELWLARDDKISKPFDLPLDATIEIVFLDHGKRKVTLAVRNKDKNEDEDGVANVRNRATNYFIFPGDSGADASWLRGKSFRSSVRVSFKHDNGTFVSKPFDLMPHTH